MSSEKKSSQILVVDDDELLRGFYSRVLTAQGYKPLCADNGEEAIGILEEKKNNISLAIIDLLMPVRTGWELIEYMKKNDKFKHIPIITITGLAASYDEFVKVKSICDAIIHKGDFELNKFNAIIKSLLEKNAS